jgi:hypothetical protein
LAFGSSKIRTQDITNFQREKRSETLADIANYDLHDVRLVVPRKLVTRFICRPNFVWNNEFRHQELNGCSEVSITDEKQETRVLEESKAATEGQPSLLG